MNSQELRALQEAYSQVYEQEEVIDEGNKDLPRLRMAGQALKKTRRGFEGARTAINSGETKDTTGGQIAVRKSTKDVTQAQTIINKLLPGGHNKESAQAKEKFNKSVGEFAKKDPELAASIRKRMVNKESYDLYDIILSHLLDEGYADTEQAAEAIMVNMSEDWRESIMERREHDEPGEDDRNPYVRSHNRAVGYKSKPKQKYGSYDNRDRGGSEEDHEKSLGLQNLIRSVQGSSVKKSD